CHSYRNTLEQSHVNRHPLIASDDRQLPRRKNAGISSSSDSAAAIAASLNAAPRTPASPASVATTRAFSCCWTRFATEKCLASLGLPETPFSSASPCSEP